MDNAWAFARLQRTDVADGEPQHATVRFAETGNLKIRTKTLSGTPAVLSPRAGNLTWMLERIGFMIAVSPGAPVVIGGLPPGEYTVSVGSSTAGVSVAAGATHTAELP